MFLLVWNKAPHRLRAFRNTDRNVQVGELPQLLQTRQRSQYEKGRDNTKAGGRGDRKRAGSQRGRVKGQSKRVELHKCGCLSVLLQCLFSLVHLPRMFSFIHLYKSFVNLSVMCFTEMCLVQMRSM